MVKALQQLDDDGVGRRRLRLGPYLVERLLGRILAALGRGESSKQIARDLGLSVRTVEAHRQSIKRRLGIEGQAELIKYAVEHAREFERR